MGSCIFVSTLTRNRTLKFAIYQQGSGLLSRVCLSGNERTRTCSRVRCHVEGTKAGDAPCGSCDFFFPYAKTNKTIFNHYFIIKFVSAGSRSTNTSASKGIRVHLVFPPLLFTTFQEILQHQYVFAIMYAACSLCYPIFH